MSEEDRRKHVRVSPKGTVILAGEDQRHRGRVVNVGIGGMLVEMTSTLPDHFVGRVVELDLRLDSRLASWMRLSGTVKRVEATGIAIAFVDIPALFAKVIDEISTDSHANRRVLSVVLIDATENRRHTIAEGFRRVGCSVIDVSTPLEAIVRLGESKFEPDLIAIADSIPNATSNELRDFVEREHPRVKLVTIGDELVDPGGLVHWLSSADPGSDLASRVRHVLSRPNRSR